MNVTLNFQHICFQNLRISNPPNLSIEIVSTSSLRAAGIFNLAQAYDEEFFTMLGRPYCPMVLPEICCFLLDDVRTIGNRCFIAVAPIVLSDGSRYSLVLVRKPSGVELCDISLKAEKNFQPGDLWARVPL